jgi:hypothetical protein
MKPARIQRTRTKGQSLPAGAVCVTRPGRWGNPFNVTAEVPQAEAVRLFAEALEKGELPFNHADIRRELAGKHLACWCRPGLPCHGDVLLEIANRKEDSTVKSNRLNEIEKADLCLSASESIRRGGDFLERFPRMLRKIIEAEAWEGRKLKTGEIITGSSLVDLVTSKPLRGWGITKDKVEALIREDVELLVMFREAVKGQEGGDTTGNKITSAARVTGTSKAYTLARLSKESPEHRRCDF